MAIYTDGWCKIEGLQVSNKNETYNNTIVNIPTNKPIFYKTISGGPEIELNNQTSAINGVVYKVVNLNEICTTLDISDINDIDSKWINITSGINTYDKTVDINTSPNSAQYYYEPFVIEHSCVIFYGSSNLATIPGSTFNKYCIILIDEILEAKIIAISATYEGGGVPISSPLDAKFLIVNAIYEDSSTAKINDGYTINPSDKIIRNVGSNSFVIQYVTPHGDTLKTSVIIVGIKKITSISGVYDGPVVSPEQEISKKYIILIAYFSDGSSTAVTDYTFVNGKIPNADNKITVQYKGLTCDINIPVYSVTQAQLLAFYKGPAIEVGHNFDINNVIVKVHYIASDNINDRYEELNSTTDVIYSDTYINKEGANNIVVQYTVPESISTIGTISTTMIVIGVKTQIVPVKITAEYTGPDIYVNHSYSPERIIAKVYYSDNSVIQLASRQFVLQTTIVQTEGPNEFTLSYKEKDITVTTTFAVNGIPADSTTENNFTPLSLQNNYPEAVRVNNRYRGPAESIKHDHIEFFIQSNIKALYEIFGNIEKNYNNLIDIINHNNTIKDNILNSVDKIKTESDAWINNKLFTTEYFIEESDNNV